MFTIFDTLERSYKGPVCGLKEWDREIIPGQTKKYLKKYGLEGTRDPENPISSDDSLADEFFKAGWELAINLGFLNVSTDRIIRVTEDELEEYISSVPTELKLGTGVDQVTWRSRKPEDGKPTGTVLGPFGNPVSEEMFVPLHQACAQVRLIDVMTAGCLVTAYGLEIKAGTPLETLAGMLELRLLREACRRAGRPGMPQGSVTGSPTEYGMFGGYGTPGGALATDFPPILTISECKVDDGLLHKAVHRWNCFGTGTPIDIAADPMVGGFAGGPEGAALVGIAQTLLNLPILQGTMADCSALNVTTGDDVEPKTLWASSIMHCALTRNTNIILGNTIHPVSGPGTEMHLYETAIGSLEGTVCGTWSYGVKAGSAKYIDYTATPLECMWAAQITKGNTGMKRAEANEIVKRLIPKVQDKLTDPPKGKSFPELYDMKTLKPKDEAVEVYTRVKKELEGMGVKFAGSM